uniref:G-protein coupled receptors family 1 profile domain-containing protein n=1 Tax=Acrobeloides nanus TaxID=290746 RepID=A0A914DRW6_9BILA
MSVFGTDSSRLYSLSACQRPFGILYFIIIPSYSGIISIVFFVTYSTSLLLFSRQMAFTKKQQAQAQQQISKAQMKLFISVSLALLCYSVFYVIPTVLQMLYYRNHIGKVFLVTF